MTTTKSLIVIGMTESPSMTAEQEKTKFRKNHNLMINNSLIVE